MNNKGSSKGNNMSVGKEIGKATWENYKAPFFKWLERKGKEGAKRYSILGKARDAWMKADWGYAQEEYLKYIYEFHSQFHVFGIQGTVELNELSTNVFVLEKPEFKKYSQSEKTTKIGGLKLVFQDNRGKKILVWGEPGVGKTTFLKQITTYAIKNTNLVPLYINIPEWEALGSISEEGLVKYLSEQFSNSGFREGDAFIEYLIDEGNAILLFDGLDEISGDQRKILIRLLEKYSTSKSQVIISCRIDAIQGEIRGYWEAQIASWDAKRIEDFIKKRFPNKQDQDSFLQDLHKNEQLRNIRSNPLLLSILCLFYSSEQGFPKNQAAIYIEATRYLIQRQEQEKRIERDIVWNNITLDKTEDLYAHLAYKSFKQNKLFLNEKDFLEEINIALEHILSKEEAEKIDSSLLLHQLVSQHGIILRRGYNTYSFLHLTFQEYYTASYIVKNITLGTLDELSKHINTFRWHEVFILTSSLLKKKQTKSLFLSIQKQSQQLINNQLFASAQNWVLQKQKKLPQNQVLIGRYVYWYILLTHISPITYTLFVELSHVINYLLKTISRFTSPDTLTQTEISFSANLSNEYIDARVLAYSRALMKSISSFVPFDTSTPFPYHRTKFLDFKFEKDTGVAIQVL